LPQFLEGEPEAQAIAQHWLGPVGRRSAPSLRRPTITRSRGFFALFPDADLSHLRDRASPSTSIDDSTVQVFAKADQFEPDAVAALLHRTITQSLPVAVNLVLTTATAIIPTPFGGGGFHDRCRQACTGSGPARSTTKTTSPARYVLAMRDDEEGLLFWNSIVTGLARLRKQGSIPISESQVR
jgi:hypothetical protein